MSEAELVRRLEKLERDNRRLKGFALAMTCPPKTGPVAM